MKHSIIPISHGDFKNFEKSFMCTPPLGVNLFVACQIADIRVDEIIPSIIPFLLILILDILIISCVPAIVTWLTGLLL